MQDRFEAKKADNMKMLIMGSVAIIVIAIIVAIAVMMTKPTSTRKSVETVVTKDELKDKLNVDVKEPSDSENVTYLIENNNIAKISYTKKVTDDRIMNFVM